jgi:hypothetical protein
MADEATHTPTMIVVNVPKAKVKLELNWDSLDIDTKLAIIQAGAEKIVQAATAKFTKANQKDEQELEASAKQAAEAKLADIHAGKWKPGRKASAGKVAGVVMTEARRLAKNIVKAQIKAAGQRISDYEAKAITEAANLYLSEHEELIAQASASIEASKALASQAAVDVKAIPVSAIKVAKNNEKKAAAKAATAAKNAGKPGPQKSTLKSQAPVPPRRPAPEHHTQH